MAILMIGRMVARLWYMLLSINYAMHTSQIPNKSTEEKKNAICVDTLTSYIVLWFSVILKHSPVVLDRVVLLGRFPLFVECRKCKYVHAPVEHGADCFFPVSCGVLQAGHRVIIVCASCGPVGFTDPEPKLRCSLDGLDPVESPCWDFR